MNRTHYLKTRRAIDVLGSGSLLVVLSPVLGITALGTLLTMGRPIFFLQQRAGHRGPFKIVKFRTMVENAEEIGGGYMDPSLNLIPPWGRFLRLTSIDELPQLVNILRGDMSFIGPRPALLDQVERYSKKQMGRLSVPQGITGLAQVKYRNEAPWSKRIESDLQYVERLGAKQDLQILAQTIAVVLTRKGMRVDQGERAQIDDLGASSEL